MLIFSSLCRECRAEVCKMLDRLIERVFTSEQASTLGPVLQPLIYALAECVYLEDKTPDGQQSSSAPAQLIQKLILAVCHISPTHHYSEGVLTSCHCIP